MTPEKVLDCHPFRLPWEKRAIFTSSLPAHDRNGKHIIAQAQQINFTVLTILYRKRFGKKYTVEAPPPTKAEQCLLALRGKYVDKQNEFRGLGNTRYPSKAFVFCLFACYSFISFSSRSLPCVSARKGQAASNQIRRRSAGEVRVPLSSTIKLDLKNCNCHRHPQ